MGIGFFLCLQSCVSRSEGTKLGKNRLNTSGETVQLFGFEMVFQEKLKCLKVL